MSMEGRSTRQAGPVTGEGGALRAGHGPSSTPPSPVPPARDSSVIWHEVECGSYAADLELWEELAADRDGPILDLGCGTGRVLSHLARRGYEVCGLDRDPKLIDKLAGTELGDARDFELGRRFELVLAPMQLLQLFDGADERRRCLRCVAEHLTADGLAAFAIVEGVPISDDTSLPLPDTREVDGWVYSSQAIETLLDGDWIRARRLRQTVSPAGELEEEVSEDLLHILTAAALEDEAMQVGLRRGGCRIVPQTDDHVGSTVVLLGRET